MNLQSMDLDNQIQNIVYRTKQFQAVDMDSLKILGVSVCTMGEAKGHGVMLDETFLNDIVKLGNRNKDGIKSHWGHPSKYADQIGTELGRFVNFRRLDNKVIADIQFIKTEMNYKYIDHIMKFAIIDPGMFGVSICFDSKGIKYDEINNIYYETIANLTAIDFVSDPAANDSLFSTETKQESKKTVANVLQNVVKSIKKISEDLNLMQKKVDDVNNYVKMYKKHASKFETLDLLDGRWLIFPGDIPAVGDMVIIRDADGYEHEAEDGIYETISGKIIEVVDSIIKSISEREIEVITEEPMGSINETMNDNEFSKLQIENKRLQAQLKMFEKLNKESEFKVKKSVNEMNLGGYDRGVQNKNGKFKDEYIVEMFKAMTSEKVVKDGPGKTKSFKISRNMNHHRQFETGFDISNAIATQFDIYRDVIYELLATDNILQYFNRLNGQAYMGGRFGYDTVLPIINFNPPYPDGYELWRAESENCSQEPTGEFNAYDRTVNVVPIRYEIDFCPPELRNLWNGLIYEGENVVPGETIIMALLANWLSQDLDRVALYGRTSVGPPNRNVVGLLTQIQLGVISGDIPATQSIAQAAYDETNAIQQLEELAYATPFQLYGKDLQIFTSPYIQQRYFQNYKAANANSSWIQIRDAAEYGRLMNMFNANFNFNPLFALWDGSANAQLNYDYTTFITQGSNIGYYLEYAANDGRVDVWQKDNRKITVSHTNYFGINYALGTNIVTNITSTLPTTYSPTTA